MRNAYKDLINHAIKDGMEMRVWDGEEYSDWTTNKKILVDFITAVEEATLEIREADDKFDHGRALVIPDNDPEETIADFTVTPYLDAWFEDHYKRCEA
jgi:hypothetical protein